MPTPVNLADCTEIVRHTRIKVDDKGSPRWAVFLNPEKSAISRIRVDGCLVVGRTAADWIVSKTNYVDVIVELKGRDVDHAIKQVVTTVEFWSRHPGHEGSGLAALIVCTEYPRQTTKIDRARRLLAQNYRAPLHVKVRNREYVFEDLAKFSEV